MYQKIFEYTISIQFTNQTLIYFKEKVKGLFHRFYYFRDHVRNKKRLIFELNGHISIKKQSGPSKTWSSDTASFLNSLSRKARLIPEASLILVVSLNSSELNRNVLGVLFRRRSVTWTWRKALITGRFWYAISQRLTGVFFLNFEIWDNLFKLGFRQSNESLNGW